MNDAEGISGARNDVSPQGEQGPWPRSGSGGDTGAGRSAEPDPSGFLRDPACYRPSGWRRRFILASGSPRRRQLLGEAGYTFDVVVSDAVEPDPEGFPTPESHVAHTAWLKADAVARRHPRDIILAADTMTFVEGRLLGKAVDRADAERILRLLMGSVHDTLTGVCLRLPGGLSLVEAVTSRVRMLTLPEPDLARYLDGGNWEGKAGAYGIQDNGDPLVEITEGSVTNVIGLPMERLSELFVEADAILVRRERGEPS
jgi:septum formation protein